MNPFEFALCIVGMVILGRVVITMIRAFKENPRHGADDNGDDPSALTDGRRVALLAQENADLSTRLVRMEERVAVLERIATDRSLHLADEIERLR